MATGHAGPGLVAMLYEVADDRDLPVEARGEDGRIVWRMRVRHRLREPETTVDRASDKQIVALLRACRSARDRLIVLLMARAGLRRGELLQAGLLAAHERAARLAARVQQLEKCLSEGLGEQTWRESGLGAPADIDTLHQRINQLEQHNLDLQQQLDEHADDLAAARATNRELMPRFNTSTQPR
ncbi:hypothetical protein AB0H34_15820 [Saccharopolyspora shandongensis]|uniref:hypothetical protein n=1 Tax=Saccharopolyspora shandongensis TaxID=418495 RepID=UPI0033E48B8C